MRWAQYQEAMKAASLRDGDQADVLACAMSVAQGLGMSSDEFETAFNAMRGSSFELVARAVADAQTTVQLQRLFVALGGDLEEVG